MVEFDAYTATTRAIQWQEAVGLTSIEGCEIRQRRGHHGFESCVAWRDYSGSEVASVSFGGTHRDRVMVEAKGEHTPIIVQRLREQVPDHSVTRIDAAHDVDAPDAWDTLLGIVLDVKAKYRLKGPKGGDWDFPEDGRTQYLGAPTSPVRTRLYEKGKQKEYRHACRENWVRLEVQVRPKGEAKTAYNTVSPIEVWGASKYTRELAARVLQSELAALPAGTVYRESELDGKVRWCCAQYGPTLMALKNLCGSWECAGRTLEEIIKAQRG